METGKMKLEIGEKYASSLTGRIYRVGMINEEWVVLESEDGSSQILTGRIALSSFYSKQGEANIGEKPILNARFLLEAL